MGYKSQMEMLLRMGNQNTDGTKNVAQAAESKKYLYNLATAKYMKGYELLYREKEYQYWFMGNINFLIQFYSLWRRQPTEMLIHDRQQWYEWSLESEDQMLVHAPVAGFITDLLKDLVFSGQVDIRINGHGKKTLNDWLQEALKDNNCIDFLRKAKVLESWSGTVVIKANYDPEVSKYPILEAYEQSRIDYIEKYGRITEIQTVDHIMTAKREFVLVTSHGRYGIKHELFRDGNKVSLAEGDMSYVEEVGVSYGTDDDGKPVKGPMLAVWKENYEHSKEFFDMHLGKSDYEGLIDYFQIADEIFSRFISQVRATQPVLFMSEELMGFRQDSEGNTYVNKPKNLGARIIELSGGLSNVDGKSIQAMFQRDVPELTGVEQLIKAFEWTVRQCLVMLHIAPSSGNIDTENVGSNTTSSAIFKREQSTHLLIKNMKLAWGKTIRDVVRLLCVYHDMIEDINKNGEVTKPPHDYLDLDIDVVFPEIDADDFNSRVEEAVKLFTAGLFDIKHGVDHAFKHMLTKTERDEMIANLEKQREAEIAQAKAKSDGPGNPGATDKINKLATLSKDNQSDKKRDQKGAK